MQKIMLLPADRSGCGLYRMIMPARAVAAEYPEMKISMGSGIMGEVRNGPSGPYVHSLPPLDSDVLIFQRPFDAVVAQCIPHAQRQGVAVVVELDDDVQNVDPLNQAFDAIQPKNNPRSNWKNVLEACRVADWVTVSTEALTRYAPHGRVSVVPNAVPRSMTAHARTPKTHGAPVMIGWAGVVATHPTDLQETCGAVSRVIDENFALFHVIGDATGVKDALRLEIEPTATGWLALPNYPEAVAQLDVGIVPLADTPFNRAKSWLKGLEMAALGIPFVASPVTEYQRLHDEYGIGILARRPNDWHRELTRLVRDEDYRRELGETYRQRVAESLLMDHTAPLWMEAWAQAFAVRHPRVLIHA